MAQFPTEEEVLKAVGDAGWLLEQEAVRTLEARKFNPRPSWAFKDPDDPSTSRELDVLGYREYFRDDTLRVHVAASILVECKQSETPYCAIGQELPDWRRAGNPTEHTLPVRYLPRIYDPQENCLEYGYAWDVFGFRAASLRHGQTNFRATQLTRLNRSGSGGKWSASNEGVFTQLVYPLAKAVRASQKGNRTQNEWPIESRPPRRAYIGFVLSFPVVLISCPLYVIDAGQKEPAFSEQKWVRTQRHLESDTLTGLFEFDVVTRPAFAEYVETVVEGMTSEVAAAVTPAPLTYTGEQWMPPGVPEVPGFVKRFPPKECA